MKPGNARLHLLAGLLIAGFSSNISAEDATAALFSLLNKGACTPDSLTAGPWIISTGPTGTHGELNWGDTLEFEQTGVLTPVTATGSFNIRKNGVAWKSVNGWTGSCVRDGTLSLYVVTGQIEIEGCLHELAIGRLDHDDNLGQRIELVFQDGDSGGKRGCMHGMGEQLLLHPGHAHGENG